GRLPDSVNVEAGEPLAVTVNDPFTPNANVVLFALVMAGAVPTVNGCVVVVTPPVVTETFCAPIDAPPVIVNVAVIVVELVTVTPLAVIPVPPVKLMVAGVEKFVPVSITVGLVPGTPANGLMATSIGGAVTVNGTSGLVVKPPEVTEMFCATGVAVPLIVNVAVIVVLFMTVVPETVIPSPTGTLMVLPAKKPEPVRVTGTLPPWAPFAGLITVSIGTADAVIVTGVLALEVV